VEVGQNSAVRRAGRDRGLGSLGRLIETAFTQEPDRG
jgi:hypothetical protein